MELIKNSLRYVLIVFLIFFVDSLISAPTHNLYSKYRLTLIINYDTIKICESCNLFIKHKEDSLIFFKQKDNIFYLDELNMKNFENDSIFFRYKKLTLFICKGLYKVNTNKSDSEWEVPLTIRIADCSHYLEYDPRWIDMNKDKRYKNIAKKYKWVYFVAWPSVRWTFVQKSEIPSELTEHENTNIIFIKRVHKQKFKRYLGNKECVLHIGGILKDYEKKYYKDSTLIVFEYYNSETDKNETYIIRNIISYNYNKKYLVIKSFDTNTFRYTIIEKDSKKIITTSDFYSYEKIKNNKKISLKDNKYNFNKFPDTWYLEEVPKSHNKYFYIIVYPNRDSSKAH